MLIVTMRPTFSNLSAHARIYLENPEALANDFVSFGPISAAQWFLSSLGVQIHTKTRYPVVDLEVTTRFNGTWKRVERGDMELDCIRQLAAVVKRGSTVFDVGAFQGTYTLLLSHLVGQSGRVCSFEPVPTNRCVLEDNIRMNSINNVVVEPFCISNAHGEVVIHVDSSGGTTSSIMNENLAGRGHDLSVPTITIDEYCEDNDVWPQGIKLDVEGAEALVTQGCQQLIRKCHPWILVEFHGHLFEEDERNANWDEIVRSAREVVFIEGVRTNLSFGDKLKEIPDSPLFRVFVQY